MRIKEGEILTIDQLQPHSINLLFNDVLASNQNRVGNPLLYRLLCRLQYLVLVAFGIDHPLQLTTRLVEDRLHRHPGLVDAVIEGLAIDLHILNRASRHPGFHRCRCNGRWNELHQSGVEGFGDQIVGAKLEIKPTIGIAHNL